MGIVVEDKKVRFDPDSHNLINNALEDNPVFQMAGGFTVYSVFRRIRTSSTKGDGNPLIYALKKKNGYTIERADVVPFLPFFYAIMDKLVPYCSMDYVIPMPSSSTVALRFAKRHGPAGDVISACSLWYYGLTADPTKVLVSITVPANDSMKIFGVTIRR